MDGSEHQRPTGYHPGARMQYSKLQVQSSCISFIEQYINFSPRRVFLSCAYRECQKNNCFQVKPWTLQKWWEHYIEWGETPVETAIKQKRYNKLMKKYETQNHITDEMIEKVREIIEENPQLYIDEICNELALATTQFVPYETVQRIVRVKLGYSLKVLEGMLTS